jgi:hypothetical protein
MGRRAAGHLFRPEQRERERARASRTEERSTGEEERAGWIHSIQSIRIHWVRGKKGALENRNEKESREIKKKRENPPN